MRNYGVMDKSDAAFFVTPYFQNISLFSFDNGRNNDKPCMCLKNLRPSCSI